MDLDDVGGIRHIMPPPENIPFHIDESRDEAAYEYSSHGGMASICTTKRSANEFYESKSDKELRHPKIHSQERLHKLSMPSYGKHGGLPKGLSFSPSLLESVAKAAPPHLLKNKKYAISRGVRNRFSHLGLIEEAKADIVKDIRDKM